MRDLIAIVEMSNKPIPENTFEAAVKQAADDFVADWAQMESGEGDREPEPRRGFIRRLRAAGFEDAYQDGVAEALMPMMRQEARRFINSLPWRGGVLPIFRNIAVAEGWEKHPEGHGGLGVYWATDDAFYWMFPHGDRVVHTIASEARPEQIDWYVVILKHLTYTENEIRIRDNERLPILGVSVNGTARDVSHLQGKLFSVGQTGDYAD